MELIRKSFTRERCILGLEAPTLVAAIPAITAELRRRALLTEAQRQAITETLLARERLASTAIARLMSDAEARYELRHAADPQGLREAFEHFEHRTAAPTAVPREPDRGVSWTGRVAGGLRNDLRRRLPAYLKDWRDGLHPKCVASAMFLFMGLVSMRGNQFFERLTLFPMDSSLYPRNHYLRRVPIRVAHVYTSVQLACLAIPWVIKSSAIAIVFPLFIAMLLPIRQLVGWVIRPDYLAALGADEVPDELGLPG